MADDTAAAYYTGGPRLVYVSQDGTTYDLDHNVEYLAHMPARERALCGALLDYVGGALLKAEAK